MDGVFKAMSAEVQEVVARLRTSHRILNENALHGLCAKAADLLEEMASAPPPALKQRKGVKG